MKGNEKNDVLSGYYDTMVMELEIFEGIMKASSNTEWKGNTYVRGINGGG